ncbi:ectoine hydroxylase [Bythopirellula goksoeyrii]|uniref:Ectoine hydroxylase n=1 Tax=Bythopirellula goksoeyrii TaxID=1400387 RepID=A0A5B9QK52_9BACT|nr:ectoine hydroxylase [Bythopirellula goksoeyrii]QEG37426.1 Phytanoyl-CoA dioxygenase (PhyH) [Bythopirellula goksoeyrii]
MTTSIAIADPYHSRQGSFWECVEREDPVVWGKADGPLSTSKLDQYHENGFYFDQDLFSATESSELLAEANRLADLADPADAEVVVEPNNRAVRSVFRVHQKSDLFRSICCDPRIVKVARQFLGGDVYLHQTRVNFKPGFNGKEFFWHSDFETWHVEDGMPRMRAVSVSIALTENNEFNGPLMVVPGSHHWFVRCVGETPEKHFEQSLKKQEYGVPDQEALQMLVDKGGIQAPKGEAGSAIFFECNLMHGSSGNLSPYPRSNLFMVFNSVENAVQEPFGNRPPRPEFLAERDFTPLEG